MSKTFMSGNTPPARSTPVLVFYVSTLHGKSEWSYELCYREGGKWYAHWDGEEFTGDVQFWSIVDLPQSNPEAYRK